MGSTPNSSRFPDAHQTLAEVHALALAEVATTAAGQGWCPLSTAHRSPYQAPRAARSVVG
jgi:hypothetical protein